MIDPDVIEKHALQFAREKTGYKRHDLLIKSHAYKDFLVGAMWAYVSICEQKKMISMYFVMTTKGKGVFFTEYTLAENFALLHNLHVIYRYSPTGVYEIYKVAGNT